MKASLAKCGSCNKLHLYGTCSTMQSCTIVASASTIVQHVVAGNDDHVQCSGTLFQYTLYSEANISCTRLGPNTEFDSRCEQPALDSARSATPEISGMYVISKGHTSLEPLSPPLPRNIPCLLRNNWNNHLFVASCLKQVGWQLAVLCAALSEHYVYMCTHMRPCHVQVASCATH